MSSDSSSPTMRLTDVVELARWQRLQDHFAHVLGLPLRTVGPSRELLATPSWPGSFPSDRFIQLLNMGEEIEQLIPSQVPFHETSTLLTPLGVTYAAVPIHLSHDHVIAYVIVGPMIVGPREPELQFRQRVGAMGLDTKALWPLVLSLKLHSFSSLRSVLNLLGETASAVVQYASEVSRGRSGGPERGLPVQREADHMLQSLLEVAMRTTRADGGSVMLFDETGRTLRIRAARGLPQEVVQGARLASGEGIAGIVVAGRKIRVIDDELEDPALLRRMTRKELVSSLVAPLMPSPQADPIGVLNLRTANPAHRFDAEDAEALGRLLDLVRVDLSQFLTMGAQSAFGAGGEPAA